MKPIFAFSVGKDSKALTVEGYPNAHDSTDSSLRNACRFDVIRKVSGKHVGTLCELNYNNDQVEITTPGDYDVIPSNGMHDILKRYFSFGAI